MVLAKSKGTDYLGPVVQSIVSLMSSLMTNLLTVVADLFSNALIFLPQNVSSFCNANTTDILIAKISMYLPYFKIEILTSR